MGRPPWDYRQIVNAIFYIVKTGCQWRFLPKDFPPWQTVYGYFRKWHDSRVWFQMHDRLRHKLREKLGKERHASAGIIDSQSVKTVLKGDIKVMTGARR
jgi:putative transposase